MVGETDQLDLPFGTGLLADAPAFFKMKGSPFSDHLDLDSIPTDTEWVHRLVTLVQMSTLYTHESWSVKTKLW